MQRITLIAICVWLIVGAIPALAQDEAAPNDDIGAWQYEDEDAEEDDYIYDGGDTDDDAKTAAGIAAAGGLAMFGFIMLWFVLYFGFIMFIMVSSMAVLIATVLAIYDCARRDFPDPNTRALWCILIVLTRWMGALIYYITVYRNDDPPLAQAVAGRPATTPSA